MSNYKALNKKFHPYAWGIRGVNYIWHGTNADPELHYKGFYVNYYVVEDTLWDMFKEDLKENFGASYESHLDNDEEFVAYCKKNARYIKEIIEESGDRRK